MCVERPEPIEHTFTNPPRQHVAAPWPESQTSNAAAAAKDPIDTIASEIYRPIQSERGPVRSPEGAAHK